MRQLRTRRNPFLEIGSVFPPKQALRVCLITSEFPPLSGGVGVLAVNLATGMLQAGAEVELVTTVPPDARGGIDRDGVDGLAVVRAIPSFNRRYVKILPLLV